MAHQMMAPKEKMMLIAAQHRAAFFKFGATNAMTIAAKAKAIAGDVTHHGQYHHNLLTMLVVSILIHFCD